MKSEPDDAARTAIAARRLLALLAAICGEQINVYRPAIEALVATLNANAKFVKTGVRPAADVLDGSVGADRI